MSEVPVRRNCSRRNSSWFVEQSVDHSVRIDAGGWRQMTAADNIPVGRVVVVVVVVVLVVMVVEVVAVRQFKVAVNWWFHLWCGVLQGGSFCLMESYSTSHSGLC